MTVHYPFPVHHVPIGKSMTMACLDQGKGPATLLFLHGLGNYAGVWTHQLSGLSDTFRCIAADLPGNGLSSGGDHSYTMAFYADSVAAFIKALGLPNVVVCGHSMGGQVAATLASTHPDLVSKLVLLAPSGVELFLPHEIMLMQQAMSMGQMFATDEMNLGAAIRQGFSSVSPDAAKFISDLHALMQSRPAGEWRTMCARSVHAMLSEPLQLVMPRLDIETLILFGDRDQLIPNRLIHFAESPESIARQAAAAIRGSRLTIVKGAGHFLQAEKHEIVNEAIRAFASA